jgi:hypothetical protein
MAPKFPWRKGEPHSADQLEFHHGGELVWVILGCFWILSYLAVVLLVGMAFNDATRYGSFDPRSKKDYREFASFLIPIGILLAMKAIYLFMGIWLIFGRTRIVLDKSSGQFTKTYSLRSFRLFQKGCDLDEATSVFLRRNIVVWRTLFSHALCLDRDGKKPFKLLDVPRRREAKGLEMARQMAEFLGVPGPRESDLAKRT